MSRSPVYQKAVENEKRKFLLGTTTLIQLFTTEDNLVAAQINLVSAQSAFAKALVQLRFATGTLVSDSREQMHVGMRELTTVPFSEE